MRTPITVLFTALLTLSLSTYCAGPVHLNVAQKLWVQFNESGAYKKTLAADSRIATDYLQQRIDNNTILHAPHQLAIVIAVNNVALNHYPSLLETQFTEDPQATLAAESQGIEPANGPIKKLYDYAIRNHVNVFVISSRHTEQRPSTLANLDRAGYKAITASFLLPQNQPLSEFKAFATAKRKQITQSGNDIVLNISASKAGLDGGYADRTVLLPRYRA